MSPKFLMIPGEARAELEALLALNVDQLRKLRGVLSDKRALKEGRGYQRVARELSVGNDQALKVLSATANVRSQRERFDLPAEALLEDLALFSPSKALETDQRAALLDLFGKNDDDYFIHKLSTLKHALVPHYVESRTIVDARPVFDKDRTKIDGFLLVTYLELTTHDPATDNYGSHPIYLTRKDIVELRERLNDAEAKLTKLQASLQTADVFD